MSADKRGTTAIAYLYHYHSRLLMLNNIPESDGTPGVPNMTQEKLDVSEIRSNAVARGDWYLRRKNLDCFSVRYVAQRAVTPTAQRRC